ncbi:MAG: sigma-54 dependent transcriptional regulator [Candidatus Poribacteria bacterium]|nr:sigma-54 dependent transcriptional regulator [Candidatus Poribacteria bacterium]
MPTILIVDDEKNTLRMLAQGLKLEGYDTLTASSGEEALQICASKPVDLVLLDILMPGMDGVETLPRLRQMQPDLNVVMMSAQKEIETAVKTMELGAKRYLIKPVGIDEIVAAIEPYLELSRLSKENEALRDQIRARDEMIGESVPIQRLHSQIRQVASSDLSVLIAGENGTGKELVANAIHQQSQRGRKPFINLNCAALPDELIESELFGHERGAFTGAATQRRGKFELADGSTLFLDEIGDMSLKAQAKVLRVLEYGELERLGGSQTLHVDVRIIAATNKSLEQEIENGTFRQDLYYRLNVVPIAVPPLREHIGDLPVLVKHFVEQFYRDSARPPKVIDPSAIRVLQSYNWPGNIRELKNIVGRLLIMVDQDVILADDVANILPLSHRSSQPTAAAQENRYSTGTPLAEMVDEAEANLIREALEANDWNIKRTAEQLKIERSNFYKKLAKYNIKRPDDS